MIGKITNKFLNKFNLEIHKTSMKKDIDLDDKEFREIYSFCSPYTMTSIERMYCLYNSLKYIIENNIKGDFVECGVWKGGSAMLIAKYLKIKKVENRKIYLYDTFEGMTKPGKFDINLFGENAIDKFSKKATGSDSSDWAFESFDQVKNNVYSTGFSKDNIVFVKGKVEKTIPEILPKNGISLLRLDTDWYESTKHELIHLYPILKKNGVLIIDDYGHWTGSKKAILEFIEENSETILLTKVDYSARIGVKTSDNN